MAAPSVVLDGAVQDTADGGNWSAGSSDADSEVQGNACIGTKVSNATTTSTVTGTTRQFAAGQAHEGWHVVHWLNCTTPTLNSKAAGGLRVNCANSAWYVAGEDDRKPGWGAYCIDPTSTPSTGGAVTSTNVFGGTVSTGSNIMGNFNNGLWDQVTVGLGVIISDGDAGSPAGFYDAWLADAGTKSNKWGWTREDNGVYFGQCKYKFQNAYVRMSGEVIVFEDNEFVSDTFYEINFGAGCDVILGENGGNIYRSAGLKQFAWIDAVGVDERGGQVIGARVIESHISAVWNSTNIVDSGVFNQNGSQINGALVKNASGTGVVIDDLGKVDGLGVTDCVGTGIDLTSQTATEITLTNIVATGNGIDVVVDNAADVNINLGAGAEVGTATNIGSGNVAIVPSLVSVAFTGLPIGHEFRVYDDDGDGNRITLGSNRTGTESLASSSFVITHSSTEAGNKIFAQVIAPGVFVEKVTDVTLSENPQIIPIQLDPDENV